MIKAYVIAENKLEIVLIKKLLPDEVIEGTKFLAPGKYDARPLATTILGADRIPVTLIRATGRLWLLPFVVE